jgi:[protein-PII] uridylyltransferase
VLLDRSDLLATSDLRGSDFTVAYTDRLDAWVGDIARDLGVPDGVAIVAVGGFGRRDVAPESDLDIVLVHTTDADYTDFADKIWYPIWDSGIKLGHRVDTVDGLLKIARTDLDTATALLNVRLLAGDEGLSLELAIAGAEQWRADAEENASRLAERLEQQHAQHGEVAFGLGPDLKNGRGGLRDVQALEWARATGVLADIREDISLIDATEVLLRARVELHRLTGRPGDRLVLDFQDDVADALGYRNSDVMMAELASAARTIAWVSDAAWFWVERSLEPHRRSTDIERRRNGITIDAGLLSLSADAATTDPLLLFEIAYVAASHRCFIARETLERLAASTTEVPTPWTTDMRARFSDLLRLGRPAISVIEAFDQVGLMSTMIPEWEPCRSKPQRNAYHRFTVDRHLLEAAAEASLLTSRVDRPDLLVVGALLHDIGKGYKGDHTDVGVDLIETIAARMGFSEDDAATLVAMCRHHLLLPDVATRRDLDDDGTIRHVATEVESVELLELLGALTEADSIATGPSAWNGSKAELVRTLVDRVRNVLRGVAPAEVVGEKFPGPSERSLLERAISDQHGFLVDIATTTITVVQTDRPGAFSRVAGVLTLNGLDIVAAAAHTETGTALSQFVVHHDEFDIGRLEQQLLLGTSGRLALESRVAERRHTYARAFKRTSAKPIPPMVTFDNRTSELATVVEVRCRDQIGVLYRISRAMSEMGIGIATARIQTIGDEIIDAFYVTTAGDKILDTGHLAETERAILHAIEKS